MKFILTSHFHCKN